MVGERRLCYAPSHSESELTRLSSKNFASFCRFQQARTSLALGFRVPAKNFCKQAAQFLNRASSPRQMLGADHVLKAAIDELLSRINDQTIATKSLPVVTAPVPSSETTVRSNSRSESFGPSSPEGERRRIKHSNLKTPPKGGSGVRMPVRRTNTQK